LWGVGTKKGKLGRHTPPVSIRCGFVGRGDRHTDGTDSARSGFNPVRICGAWGPSSVATPPSSPVRFNPVRICGAWGPTRPARNGRPSFNPVRICGAWGPTIVSLMALLGVRFNPVRICGAWGLESDRTGTILRRVVSIRCGFVGRGDPREVKAVRRPDRVSIRCGFVGRGDSTPVCGGSELGKRGASRQPPARGGSVIILTIMLEH